MPPQVIPEAAIRAISQDDEDGAQRIINRSRVILTPEMLASTGRTALFEGIYKGHHVPVSPLFSPQGTRLIGYQIEEGDLAGTIVLPEQLRPVRSSPKAPPGLATKEGAAKSA